jgi:lipid II isoglutaminyl synthase (glutamine-hydrolysing)
MPARTELGIVLVYPELLGTYGDRGNGLALVRRAEARGLPARLVEVPFGEPLPTTGDVYLLGGSEDAAQVLALRSLLDSRAGQEVLSEAPACLAVCAGFQLLAREFTAADGQAVPGLGLLDVSCGRLAGPRAVGEVVARPVGLADLPVLTGYENHQGDATVGPGARPLGRVVAGVGNGQSGLEGAVQDNVVATYLHGPVLVRNPALADHLLERSTGPLAAYEDDAVEQLRRERLAAASGALRRSRPGGLRRGRLSRR